MKRRLHLVADAPGEATLDHLVPGRSGHFLLESGHHGERWLDLDALFLNPARIQPLIERIAEGLKPHRVEFVCGPFTGGALAAYAVASLLGCGFVAAERRMGTAGMISYGLPDASAATVRGRRVAVIDDAINAGSATRGSMAALEAAGAAIVAIGGVIVLGETMHAFAAARGLPLIAAVSHPARIWLPAECPLCIAGVPLEDVVPRNH